MAVVSALDVILNKLMDKAAILVYLKKVYKYIDIDVALWSSELQNAVLKTLWVLVIETKIIMW